MPQYKLSCLNRGRCCPKHLTNLYLATSSAQPVRTPELVFSKKWHLPISSSNYLTIQRGFTVGLAYKKKWKFAVTDPSACYTLH